MGIKCEEGILNIINKVKKKSKIEMSCSKMVKLLLINGMEFEETKKVRNLIERGSLKQCYKNALKEGRFIKLNRYKNKKENIYELDLFDFSNDSIDKVINFKK
jgi:hypothetical protein